MKIITLAAWKRVDYFQQVMNSLENAIGIENYQVWVSIDGGHSSTQDQMAKIANNSSVKTKVFKQKKNFGCAKNTWKILETGFQYTSNKRIIHLEDDITIARDFIPWMEAGLDKYENNKKVFSIAASSNNKKIRTNPNDARRVNVKPFFSCWGWGTWERIWNEMRNDWFGISWKRNAGDPKPRGAEFLRVINKTDKGSWAWPMNNYWRKDRYEVKPLISRIYNIGRTGLFENAARWDKKHKPKKWMGNLSLPIPEDYDLPDL